MRTPYPSPPLRPMLLLPLPILFLGTLVLAAEETAPLPVRLFTQDGARLQGWISLPAPLILTEETHPQTPREIAWNQVRQIDFSERGDPQVEAAASAAVKDLGSPDFATRQRALLKLKALGSAGARVLRQAARSEEAEVAVQAQGLLGELAAGGSEPQADKVLLADDRVLLGQLEARPLRFLCRLGLLELPLAQLTRVQMRKGEELEPQPKPERWTALPIPAFPQPPDGSPGMAKRIEADDGGTGPQADPALAAQLTGLRQIAFDTVAGTRGPPEKLQAGDPAQRACGDLGVRIRAAAPGQKVLLHERTRNAGGVPRPGRLSAGVATPQDQGDLLIDFPAPQGPKDPGAAPAGPAAADEPHAWGVHSVAFLIGTAPAETIGLEAFDACGRRLARFYNRGNTAGLKPAGAPRPRFEESELLGLRSRVPIARVRLYRAGNTPDALLALDGILLSQPAPAAAHPAWLTALTLLNGDRLTGRLAPADPASEAQPPALALVPALLSPERPPLQIPLAEVRRLEPALPTLSEERPAPDAPKDAWQGGAQHLVQFQGGASFRACLWTLDEKSATFRLAGGASIQLPRLLLRKIDLWPDLPQETEGRGATALTPTGKPGEERPGVEFLRQPSSQDAGPKPADPAGAEAAGPGEAGKKKIPGAEPGQAAPSPAQGLPRMEHAEILKADFQTRELVVDPKDGAGAWPIDLNTARYLVFPALPAAAPGPAADWLLTLRQGSTLGIRLSTVGPERIQGEFHGVRLELPLGAVGALERIAGREK